MDGTDVHVVELQIGIYGLSLDKIMTSTRTIHDMNLRAAYFEALLDFIAKISKEALDSSDPGEHIGKLGAILDLSKDCSFHVSKAVDSDMQHAPCTVQ